MPRNRYIRTEEAKLPTRYGEFRLIGYLEKSTRSENLAIVMGDVYNTKDVLVRVHSECLTGESLGSLRCDCGDQLSTSLKIIAAEKKGLLIYLRQEGRGIGLFNKVKAYHIQDQGMDTVAANLILGFEADERKYDAAAYVIKDLGIRSIILLTNNPEKIRALSDKGIVVSARKPLIMRKRKANAFYMETKGKRMGHLLSSRSDEG